MVQIVYSLLAVASILPAVAAQSMCYFPDGSQSPTDFVCNSTTGDGFSSCCGHQFDGSAAYCMSNGLCLSDMNLSRGSCTDKSWKSGNCAQVCTTTSPNGGVGVRPCGYTNTWTCDNGTGCSANSIKIPTGDFILTNAQLNDMNAQRVPSKDSSSSAAGNQPSTIATTTATAIITATTTATPTGLVEASQVATVGAGVGIPLGLLAAGFLGLWLFERRKTKRLESRLAFEQHQFSQAPGSSYHQSMSAGAANMNRMPSHHSSVMSPMGAAPGTAMGGGGHHPAYSQSSVMKPNGMQRMVSVNSAHHPAYQGNNMGMQYDNGPPPPPKAFAGNWAAEAPGDEGRPTGTHHRGFSSAQELPTGS